jgi:hypothetical protein
VKVYSILDEASSDPLPPKRRTSKTLVWAIALALSGSIYEGHYQWQQHHLSGDFKHILLVVFDSSNTSSDVSAYIHDARLAARTPKDNDLLGKVETLIALRTRSAQEQQESLQRSIQQIGSFSPSSALHMSKEELLADVARQKVESDYDDDLMNQSRKHSAEADALGKSISAELNLSSK